MRNDTIYCFVFVAGILCAAAGHSQAVANEIGGELSINDLSEWTRHPNNPIFTGNLIAGDAHVWEESPGRYRMVYTDDADGNDEHQGIAMATSTDLVNWTLIPDSQYPNGVILAHAGPGGHDMHLETAFYRKANNGQHQIYYIGYPNEEEYNAAIYKAESDNVEGPYRREAAPIIPWTPGGADAQAMTSPTIVEHEGALYMTYIGWEGYPDGPVSIMGATSDTDGQGWVKVGALSWSHIFGVEAHTEKGPDGLFYRVGVIGDEGGGDVITLGQSAHPFGPYTELPDPILTPGGPSVGEGDSIMSPSLLFVESEQMVYMHYAAVDTGGWPWVMSLATCAYGRDQTDGN